MTYKANSHNYKNKYSKPHISKYISNKKLFDVFTTLFIVSICIFLFKKHYNQFSEQSKTNVKQYHKTVFERSMSAYKAQIFIPNNYKDADLVATSKIIQNAFSNPSLKGCKELWDVVFTLGEKNLPYNNKVLANSDVSIEVITDKTCRFFLKNNSESLYFFDYALNI